MALLKIIKLTNNVWKHNSDLTGDFILTKFYAKNEFSKFLIVESYGAKRNEYLINEIEVYNIGGSAETFTTFELLFIRLKALGYTGYYEDGTFIFVPADYISDDASNALTIGTDNKFFVPVSGGGGGTSLRTSKYEWFSGTNTFASTTNWYGARRNVANQLPLPLWSSGESYYDGTTSHVTNVRMPSYIIDFNQKIERLTFTYESISVGFTFRLIYYELNPSGTTNEGVNEHVVYEAVIAANTGGYKKQNIYIPTAFTATQNGYFAVVIYNNSGSTVTAPNWQITANAIEVI